MLEMVIPVLCMASFVTTLYAQTEPALVNNDGAPVYAIRFRDSPIDAALNILQQLTGKDITVDLGVQATITLATPKVTAGEGIDLITRALNEQGIRLEDLDDNTIRVRGVPTPRPESSIQTSMDESLKRRAEYGERRRQRMIARQPPVEIPKPINCGEKQEPHLQDNEAEEIRHNPPPLDAQKVPDNMDIPGSYGVAVPAIAIGEHSLEQSSENNADNIE